MLSRDSYRNLFVCLVCKKKPVYINIFTVVRHYRIRYYEDFVKVYNIME